MCLTLRSILPRIQVSHLTSVSTALMFFRGLGIFHAALLMFTSCLCPAALKILLVCRDTVTNSG